MLTKSSLLAALLASFAEAIPAPQPAGVTSAIAPSGAAPEGCLPNYPGTFGIAAITISPASGAQPSKRAESGAGVSEVGDGQPQAATSAAPISEIHDGQPQAAISAAPISQIHDGQPQVAPTMAPISQIHDGQIQAATSTKVYAAISQIRDGQIQAPTTTMKPITQIHDGQIQAPISTVPAITQIHDGQIQAPTAKVAAISQIHDGQIQAPTSTATPTYVTITNKSTKVITKEAAATQIHDGQPQAQPAKPSYSTTVYMSMTTSKVGGGPAPSVSAEAKSVSTAPSSGGTQSRPVACKSGADSLTLQLANGKLTDTQNRVGYIASNYQFQFDAPPQAGAIFTSGWSVCPPAQGDVLALGEKKSFWQCRSGGFYNLYDRKWAAQCVEVQLRVVELVDC